MYSFKHKKYRDDSELIIIPGHFHPAQAQDRCSYMGFHLPYADNAQDRQRIQKFAKAHQVNLVHIFGRDKEGGIYSLGRQTDIVLNEVQHSDFLRGNEHFIYDCL